MLSPEVRAELVKAEQSMTVPEGTALIQQGVPPENLIIINSGTVAVSLNCPRGPASLDYSEPGKVFGMRAMVSGELPERLVRANVGPGFLELWGMGPSFGHGFSAEEQRAANVVLITDRYWQSHFGANPAAVGQVLRFSTSSVTVAGVLPVAFRFPVRDVDIFQPIAQNFLTLREITYYTPVGRLRPGIGINQARADLTAVQSRLAQTYPDTDGNWKLDVQPLQSEIVAGFGNSLWLLFGAVSLVLLIACINVAALLLVRARQREREVATRLALGATKAALSLQFLMETAILALCGTVIGLGIAALSLPLLRGVAPSLPRLDEVRMLLHRELVGGHRVLRAITRSPAVGDQLFGRVGAAEEGREQDQHRERQHTTAFHGQQIIRPGRYRTVSSPLRPGNGR